MPQDDCLLLNMSPPSFNLSGSKNHLSVKKGPVSGKKCFKFHDLVAMISIM